MDKTKVTKFVTRTVVGMSTSFTVANALRNNVNPGTPAQTAMLWIGSVAVGAFVSDKVCVYTDETIDELVESVNNAKSNN